MNIKSIFFIVFLFFYQLYGNSIPTVENLHVCTVASDDRIELQQLLHSCACNQIKMDILGFGLPYKSHGQKLTYVMEYLNQFPDDDIVLFVDAYDVLFLANAQSILDLFLAKGVPCIFSAEHYGAEAWPYHYLVHRYPHSPTVFRYLCSGTYIGYVSALKKCLQGAIIDGDFDDQGQLSLYFVDHQNEIALDYYCELFFPLVLMQEHDYIIDTNEKKVICKATWTKPCIIHGNGTPAKKFYQTIYNVLFEREKT